MDCVAFSVDGKLLASGGRDNQIYVWNTDTAARVQSLAYPRGGIKALAFSPDSTCIISGHLDGYLALWTLGTNDGCEWDAGATVDSLDVSPDGERVVTSTRDEIRIWDLATRGELVALGRRRARHVSVAFDPTGRYVASTCADKTVRLWDGRTGEQIANLRGHHGLVADVAFHPDGRQIASGGADGTVKIWCPVTDQETVWVSGHWAWGRSVAFSPNGTRIVTCGDHTLRIWDAYTTELLRSFPCQDYEVITVAFSPAGQLIASGSADGIGKIWDVETGQCVQNLIGHEAQIHAIAFAPDGRRLATGSVDTTLRVWNLATGAEERTLRGHDGQVKAVSYSPNGTHIVSGGLDARITMWDSMTGDAIFSLGGHRQAVQAVAFSPDGRRFASGGDDGILKIWEADTGTEFMTISAHHEGISCVAFSPDCARVVTGSADRTLKIWNAITGEQLLCLRGHEQGIGSVAFSPDGRQLVSFGAPRGNLAIWDTTKLDGESLQRRQTAVLARREAEALFASLTLKSDVLDYLQVDRNLPEHIRLAVVAAVERQEENPNELAHRSWETVRFPDVQPQRLRLALRVSERAHELAPNHAGILNTLGVAQYRLRRLEDALVSLTRAKELRGWPQDLAFRAMVLHELGRVDEATAQFVELCEAMTMHHYARDDTMQAHLLEAENVLRMTCGSLQDAELRR